MKPENIEQRIEAAIIESVRTGSIATITTKSEEERYELIRELVDAGDDCDVVDDDDHDFAVWGNCAGHPWRVHVPPLPAAGEDDHWSLGCPGR